MSEPTGKAKGGAARAQALTPEQRKEIAKKAADARWSAPKALYVGELSIGELTIACAVLPDGTRVLSQRGVGRALGRGYGGKDFRATGDMDAGGKLPFFMNANALKPFISSDLAALVSQLGFHRGIPRHSRCARAGRRPVGGRGILREACRRGRRRISRRR